MSKKKKDSPLRKVTKSVTGFLPSSIGEPVEEALARILSGLKSQVASYDPVTGETDWSGWPKLAMAAGNPAAVAELAATNQLPGIVNETLSLPAMLEMTKREPGAKEGFIKSHIPDVSDQIPDWAFEAANRASLEHEAVRNEASLSEPKGFIQNAAEGVGVMLGQLPVPVSRLKALKALQTAKPSSRILQGVKTAAGSAPEWFSPTIDPSVANYLSGAAFGGGLGAYSDYAQQQNEESEAAAPALAELAKRYTKTGSLVPGMTGYAEGGKVVRLIHFVVDNQTGEKMSSGYRSKGRAQSRADTLDQDYGAYRYRVKSEPAPEGLTQSTQWKETDDVPSAFAEGGKVSALARLSKIIQGAPSTSENIDELAFGTRRMKNVPSTTRERLNQLMLQLGEARLKGEETNSLHDQVLNHLAEIYLSPDVTLQAKSIPMGNGPPPPAPIIRRPAPNGMGTLPNIPWDQILNSSKE